MKRRLWLLVWLIACLLLGLAGYVIVRGDIDFFETAQARSEGMPLQPHIVILGRAGNVLGAFQEERANWGITQVATWQAARQVAKKRPLDGLVISADSFGTMSTEDTRWLHSQLDDGVTLVAIGLEDDEFARILGLKTLLAPNESFAPRGKNGYRLVQAFIVGDPEAVKELKYQGWIDDMIGGRNNVSNGVPGLVYRSLSKSQGMLENTADFNLFLFQLRGSIQSAYETRAQYKKSK